MKRVLLALALAGLWVGVAYAQPDILSDGVFIFHSPPGVIFTDTEDYCLNYGQYGITSCDQQNNSVMTQDPSVWYIIAAWRDAKHWCGVEFGFGAYANASNVIFLDHGACPASALTIPTSGWPGPNQGIALAAYDVDWNGNFQPVYFFGAYAYYALPSVIQLGANPATGFGGFANCLTPPASFGAVQFGALGILAQGVPACPPEPTQVVCCVDEVCHLVYTQEECDDMGGIFHPEWTSCGPPDPCYIPPIPDVCCVGTTCYFITEDECADMQGVWHPEYEDCGPPNPCDYTPAEPSSWGAIKAIYR